MDNEKNILITGASGLIGQRLKELLRQRRHTVSSLGRTKKGPGSFVWDIEKEFIEPGTFNNVDTIIHLAGAGVADKRWTKSRKQEIRDSRVKSTRLLFDELEKDDHKVKTFISASAIGYYGFEKSDEFLSENTSPGNDFLADVTRQWEEEADKIQTLGIRVVKVRTGIVLSKNDGALKPMVQTIKLYAGAPLGSGRQYVSWIHIDDLCAIYITAVENDNMQGAYNAVAPNPVTNKELTNAIARKLNKPLFLPPVPGLVLKLMLGEVADLVVNGVHVSSKKIEQTGLRFKFNTVEEALNDLLT